MDYRRLFSRTLAEMMDEVFVEHGIDYISEEEFEDTVDYATKKCYLSSVSAFRRQEGLMIQVRPSAFIGRTHR